MNSEDMQVTTNALNFIRSRQDLIDFVKTRQSDVINSIKTTGELPEEKLKTAVEAFVSTLEKKEE